MAARTSKDWALLSEGFDCNPFVYNYVFEKAWDIDIHKDVRVGRKNWLYGVSGGIMRREKLPGNY